MPLPLDRPYDLVLYGATGFTGGLTATALASRLPAGARWAIAGRDPKRLAAVRAGLPLDGTPAPPPDLLTADTSDPATVDHMAAATRVLASTVGPYLRHGDPVVGACARQGTDYADLAGEPEFVDRSYLRHHATAVDTGARLVHSCGFDSVPHDLGVHATVGALPRGVPLTVRGYVRLSGTISAGTYHSALTAFSRPWRMLATARRRRDAEGETPGRRLRDGAAWPRWSSARSAWVLPLPTIDPRVVVRSARALDRYGPDFRYTHHAVVPRLSTAVGLVGVTTGLAAVAQLPLARDWAARRMTPGEGPSEERRAASWFHASFVGEGGGRRAVTEVSGGDPGYGETATMLAESALCLAFDDLPATAGQVTPAVAMGDALTTRLVAAGIDFRVRTY